MKSYTTQFLRNVGIVGHGDTGKTQLVSSLLYTAGMTPRLGKVADGNTVTDWDEEEIARKISIQTGLAVAEWVPTSPGQGQGEKRKINFLDTPGYSTFVNETRASLIAADAALVVVDAVAGVQVVTEKVWDYCTEYSQPRAIVINWMDRELASFDRALEAVQEVFGRTVVPLELPIGAEKQFRGVVDLLAMKALVYTPDGDGRAKIEEIPAELASAAREAHEKLVEMVAEGDDKLMEEFFEKGTLPLEDLKKGLRLAFQERRLFPVVLSSALRNIGSDAILNLILDIFPDPAARIPEPAITFAIEPKTRADEDRIGQGIHKILEEDLALRFSRDPQTKEFLLAGSGQQHIEVVVAKLRKRFKVDVTLKPPKVPYRETIRAKADAEGKHKKQTGGHGQFGVCRVRMEPLPRGAGFEFVDDIFGGSIPKNYIPSVEKG